MQTTGLAPASTRVNEKLPLALSQEGFVSKNIILMYSTPLTKGLTKLYKAACHCPQLLSQVF